MSIYILTGVWASYLPNIGQRILRSMFIRNKHINAIPIKRLAFERYAP